MDSFLSLLAWGPSGWGDELATGTWLTLRLAFATLPVGLAIGLGVALMKTSGKRVLVALGDLYTTVFRGLPELLTIFIVYYGGQFLLARAARTLAPDLSIQMSPFLAGLLALALVVGAFSSEVFVGALRGVPRGQGEAARALGLGRAQSFRLVLLPQLWRLALPGLANNWLVLLKDTSLVSVIALTDLMRQTNLVVATTKMPFTFYAVACGIYLSLSLVSTAVALALERRANRGFAGARR